MRISDWSSDVCSSDLLDPASVVFENGKVRAGGKSVPLAKAAADGDLVAEDLMEYGDLAPKYQQSTFGAHFVEAAVDAATGEIRVCRMLAVGSEAHPSELQSLMRISYAVFCLKTKKSIIP